MARTMRAGRNALRALGQVSSRSSSHMALSTASVQSKPNPSTQEKYHASRARGLSPDGRSLTLGREAFLGYLSAAPRREV